MRLLGHEIAADATIPHATGHTFDRASISDLYSGTNLLVLVNGHARALLSGAADTADLVDVGGRQTTDIVDVLPMIDQCWVVGPVGGSASSTIPPELLRVYRGKVAWKKGKGYHDQTGQRPGNVRKPKKAPRGQTAFEPKRLAAEKQRLKTAAAKKFPYCAPAADEYLLYAPWFKPHTTKNIVVFKGCSMCGSFLHNRKLRGTSALHVALLSTSATSGHAEFSEYGAVQSPHMISCHTGTACSVQSNTTCSHRTSCAWMPSASPRSGWRELRMASAAGR